MLFRSDLAKSFSKRVNLFKKGGSFQEGRKWCFAGKNLTPLENALRTKYWGGLEDDRCLYKQKNNLSRSDFPTLYTSVLNF